MTSPPCTICGGPILAEGVGPFKACGKCMAKRKVCPSCLGKVRKVKYGWGCPACETNWGVEEDGRIL